MLSWCAVALVICVTGWVVKHVLEAHIAQACLQSLQPPWCGGMSREVLPGCRVLHRLPPGLEVEVPGVPGMRLLTYTFEPIGVGILQAIVSITRMYLQGTLAPSTPLGRAGLTPLRLPGSPMGSPFGPATPSSAQVCWPLQLLLSSLTLCLLL